MSKSFHVTVGSYEGPFDLLLQLIARHKVDVYDVAIADITDEYLALLRAMEHLDLEVTTEFLVVAATLVELKAARLLPGDDDPELDDLALEARDLLYARLVDYRTFKQASAWLGERLGAHAGYVAREVGPGPDFDGLVPPFSLPVDGQGLAAIAARTVAERSDREVDVSHLQPIRITVREAAGLIVDELARAGGRARFAALTAGCHDRVEVIVCFLALLELYKLDRIDLHQAGCFGEIEVQWVAPDGVWREPSLISVDGMEEMADDHAMDDSAGLGAGAEPHVDGSGRLAGEALAR